MASWHPADTSTCASPSLDQSVAQGYFCCVGPLSQMVFYQPGPPLPIEGACPLVGIPYKGYYSPKTAEGCLDSVTQSPLCCSAAVAFV